MRIERRSSYRIALTEKSASVEDPSSRARAAVRVLNAGGGALALEGSRSRDDLQSTGLLFRLGDCPPFSADIALLGPASPSEGDGLEAFRFNGLSREALGTLSSYLCAEHAARSVRLDRLFSGRGHTIEFGDTESHSNPSSPSSIEALLRYYLEECKGYLFVYLSSRNSPLLLEHIHVEGRSGVKELTASWERVELDELDEDRERLFFFSSPLAVTWFRSTLRRTGAKTVAITMPPRMSQSGFRTSKRVDLTGEQRMTVTIEDPFLCGERIKGQIFEVGGNGFSMEFDRGRAQLFPGQPLDRVRVDLTMGSVSMDCVLRICKPMTMGSWYMAGFEIVGFASPEDHDRWMRYVIPCLFPDVRIGDEHAVLSAWIRLEQSGYLELIHESERARLRAPFFEDWTRHAAHGGSRARFLLCHRDGAPIGITAANLIYPKTCLVHSGGIDKSDQGKGSVLKLYAASFLYAYSAGDYCVSLFDAEKHINTVLFQQFVRQYTARQDHVFDSLTVYKWHESTSLSIHLADISAEIEVVGSTSELLRFMWQHQQRVLSPLELDAYGWSSDNGAMRRFSESCARSGYERRRQIFFAIHQGSPIAALVAETGSEGMNVFSLLNSCSITLFAGCGRRKTEALRMLLARAIDFYNGAGKGAFLLLGTSGCEEEANLFELGFSYVAQGWRWLAARRVIPAYISYLEDLAIIRRGTGRRSHPSRSLPLREGVA